MRRRLKKIFRKESPVVRILHKGSIREGLAIPTRPFSVLIIAIGVDCFRKQISDHDVQFSLSNVKASYERSDSLVKSGNPWLKVRIWKSLNKSSSSNIYDMPTTGGDGGE